MAERPKAVGSRPSGSQARDPLGARPPRGFKSRPRRHTTARRLLTVTTRITAWIQTLIADAYEAVQHMQTSKEAGVGEGSGVICDKNQKEFVYEKNDGVRYPQIG